MCVKNVHIFNEKYFDSYVSIVFFFRPDFPAWVVTHVTQVFSKICLNYPKNFPPFGRIFAYITSKIPIIFVIWAPQALQNSFLYVCGAPKLPESACGAPKSACMGGAPAAPENLPELSKFCLSLAYNFDRKKNYITRQRKPFYHHRHSQERESSVVKHVKFEIYRKDGMDSCIFFRKWVTEELYTTHQPWFELHTTVHHVGAPQNA